MDDVDVVMEENTHRQSNPSLPLKIIYIASTRECHRYCHGCNEENFIEKRKKLKRLQQFVRTALKNQGTALNCCVSMNNTNKMFISYKINK